ncbi:MAG: TonB-dependent receptor [Pseudomonadota bacterium]
MSSRSSAGLVGATILLVMSSGAVRGQADSTANLEAIAVTESTLEQTAQTGSRLGLSVLETPASVEVIESDTMQKRGHRTISEAVNSVPGVLSGESPAAPSTFSIRGFTRSQITFLRDGLWVGPTNMTMRPQNTFNLEQIQVLKGPASAVYGQGAVAGVINAIPRMAEEGEASANILLGVGRYNALDFGAGGGGEVARNLWGRVDVSHYRSDGFIEDMDPRSTNLTGSLLWKPIPQLDVRLSADYLMDDLANYWGTPLTPISFSGSNATTGIIKTTTGETLDKRILKTNYNVEDGLAESSQLFLRNDITFRISDAVTATNTAWGFIADRDWANAEGYIFNTTTEQIDRTNGYFFVQHDQKMVGNRFQLQVEKPLGRFENNLVVGFEYADLNFERTRGFRFSAQPGDSVDFLDPVVGVYGPRELRGVSPTDITTKALFVEDRFSVTPEVALHLGLRQEWLDLVRKNFDRNGNLEAGSSFSRDFSNLSWKAGVTYQPMDNLTFYAQYAQATDPVNSNIFLVNSGEDFDLTDGRQWEVGAKAILFGGRASITAAYFDIERDDVTEQIGVDSATIVGGRNSRGVELGGAVAITRNLTFSANAAYTDAEFEPSANFVANAGNRPPNVPEFIANAFLEYRNVAGVPLDVEANVRYVGDRYGDNANTVTLLDYTLLGLRATYRFDEDVRLSLLVTNLLDEEYSPWADVFYLQQTDPSFPYANQVLLGEPRNFQIRLEAFF